MLINAAKAKKDERPYSTMLILMQILLQLLAFTLLSLSLTRHYTQVMSQAQRLAKSTVLTFRVSGYLLLIIAIVYGVYSWGLALGLVYSLATATLVSTFLAVLLTYKPHYLAFVILPFKPKDLTL